MVVYETVITLLRRRRRRRVQMEKRSSPEGIKSNKKGCDLIHARKKVDHSSKSFRKRILVDRDRSVEKKTPKRKNAPKRE